MANLDASDADNIGAKDSRGSGAITVANVPLATVLLEGRRGGRVEAYMLLAGRGGAGARGEPNVGGALLECGNQLRFLFVRNWTYGLERLRKSGSLNQLRDFGKGANRTI